MAKKKTKTVNREKLLEKPTTPAQAAQHLEGLLINYEPSIPFQSRRALANALSKQHPKVSEDSFYADLSALFGRSKQDQPPLRESLELALHKSISEYSHKNKGKLDESWRTAVKGNLQMLALPKYVGKEDSEGAVVNSLCWADAVTVVTNELDPLSQGWPSHPLDTLVYDLVSNENRMDDSRVAPRGRPHLIVVAKKDGEAKNWLYRMLVPFFIHRHRDLLLGEQAVADGDIARLSIEFLAPIGKAFEGGRHVVRMHTLPGSSCWLPFFMTEHGWVRQAFLNLPHPQSPRLIAVPSSSVVADIGLPLSPSSPSRVELTVDEMNREASKMFIRYVRHCRAEDRAAMGALAKGERFVAFDPLAFEESAARESAARNGETT